MSKSTTKIISWRSETTQHLTSWIRDFSQAYNPGMHVDFDEVVGVSKFHYKSTHQTLHGLQLKWTRSIINSPKYELLAGLGININLTWCHIFGNNKLRNKVLQIPCSKAWRIPHIPGILYGANQSIAHLNLRFVTILAVTRQYKRFVRHATTCIPLHNNWVGEMSSKVKIRGSAFGLRALSRRNHQIFQPDFISP